MQLSELLTNGTIVFFAANTLYVISYMLTSMFWLRLLAVIAAVSTMPYFYLQPEPLWNAIFWQGCFLAVNLVNLLILLYSMRSTSFDEDEQKAYELKFFNLKPHELRPLFKIAEREQLEQERILLMEDENNDRLYLVLEGRCTVLKHGREIAGLEAGQFVGELSFFSDEAVSADVMATAGTRLMYWEGDRLRGLFRRQGLYETYFHSLCSLDVARKLRAMSALQPASATLE